MPDESVQFSEFARNVSYAREEALCEQIALIVTLYWNDAQRMQQIVNLMGGGVILAFQFNTTSWPPSYAVIRQEDRIYVVLTGTMSAPQMIGHIIGSGAAPYEEGRTFVHPLWYIQAKRLSNEIGPIIEASGTYTEINIAGHSWGGAVAFLLALHFVRSLSGPEVHLITFGAPKAICHGFEGQQPIPNLRVVNTDDIVTNLPPINPLMVAARVAIIGPLLGKVFGYEHHGRRIELTPRPDIFQDSIGDEEPFRTPNDFTRTIRFEHSSITYLDRILLWLKRGRGVSATTLAGDVASALEHAETVQTPVDLIKLSEYTLGLPQGPDEPYQHDPGKPNDAEAMLPVQSGGVLVSGPTVRAAGAGRGIAGQSGQSLNIGDERGTSMTASGYWKIGLVINNGANGCTTSVVYKGTPDMADAIKVASKLAEYRSAILGNNAAGTTGYVKSKGAPRIEYMRVSDAKNLRISQLIVSPDQKHFGYGGTTTNGSDVFSTALSIRLKGQHETEAGVSSYSNHQFIGMPDVIVSDGVYKGGATVLTTGKTFDGEMRDYLNLLTGTALVFGYMGQSVSEVKKEATNWTLNTRSRYQCVVEGHEWVTGDRVRVTSADVPLVDGVSKIVKVDDNTIYLVRDLGTTHPLPIHAKIQRIQLKNGTKPEDFYRFVKPDGGWVAPFGIKVSKKNIGREFTPVSFRKRVKTEK